MIALKEIRLPRSLQTRVRLNAQTVAEYASAMKDGAGFPPIDIFYDGTCYFLGDGWHRCLAGKQWGCSEIAAIIHQGNHKDALCHALGANTEHGLRRTNADKRRSVQLALKAFSEQSDRSIAETCRVSQTMVSALRNQLTDSVSLSPRIGLDGKARRVPVRAKTSATSMAERSRVGFTGSPQSTSARPPYSVITPVFSVLAATEQFVQDLDRSPGWQDRLESVRQLTTEYANLLPKP